MEQSIDRLFSIFFIILAVGWTLLIADYSSLDPSLNTVTDAASRHVFGTAGSYVADFFVQLFGKMSYALTLFLSAIALRLGQSKSFGMWWRAPLFFLGCFCFSLSLSPIFGMHMGSLGCLGYINFYTMAPKLSLIPSLILAFTSGVFLIFVGAHLSFLGKKLVRLKREMVESVDYAFYVIRGMYKFGWPRFRSILSWEKVFSRSSKKKNSVSVPSFQMHEFSNEMTDTWGKGPSQMTLFNKSLEEKNDLPLDHTQNSIPIAVKEASESVKEEMGTLTNFKDWIKDREKKKNTDTPVRQKQPSLFEKERSDYALPQVDLLDQTRPKITHTIAEDDVNMKARHLEQVLGEFGVKGDIVNIRPGPVVTMYELRPAPGIKSSRVIGLAEDIARSMSALSARIAVIPGKNVIGIELPNHNRETVYMKEILLSDHYIKNAGHLGLILGKDIGGLPVIADLARMPHLLVAGTTGSGKSVSMNTMILSLLFKYTPEQCKFIMVDPKMLEFSIYNDIPHLLTPVVTDPKKAVIALKWAVKEMENRYRAMSKLGVRNIDGYNTRLKEAKANGELLQRKVQTGFDPDSGKPIFETQPIDLTPLPYIVVVVDEMADLMLVAGKDIEAAVQRLAQMARAAGIHLIMATQRPSVDVITGTIKANFPTRISFMVTSKIDSRTILGEQGAEQLLGQGDMLYMANGGRIQRVHGPFVKDEEVERIVEHLKAQAQPNYIESITESDEENEEASGEKAADESGNELYQQALDLILREGKASTSFIQRHLQIGYNRAARLIDQMEKKGVISAANHAGKREIIGG